MKITIRSVVVAFLLLVPTADGSPSRLRRSWRHHDHPVSESDASLLSSLASSTVQSNKHTRKQQPRDSFPALTRKISNLASSGRRGSSSPSLSHSSRVGAVKPPGVQHRDSRGSSAPSVDSNATANVDRTYNITDVIRRIDEYRQEHGFEPLPAAMYEAKTAAEFQHQAVQLLDHSDRVPGQWLCNYFVPSGYNVCECSSAVGTACSHTEYHYQAPHYFVQTHGVGSSNPGTHFWPGSVWRSRLWDCFCRVDE